MEGEGPAARAPVACAAGHQELKPCLSADGGKQVREVVVEGEGAAARATGVRLADGRVFLKPCPNR